MYPLEHPRNQNSKRILSLKPGFGFVGKTWTVQCYFAGFWRNNKPDTIKHDIAYAKAANATLTAANPH
jgi:hypothetical protein